MFGFDFYFIPKGTRLSTWETKLIGIGGSNLTNIDFANITSQMKFIDTYKYFQNSSSNLASTIDETAKKKTEVMLQKFILQHHYFSIVWKLIS